MKGWEPVYKRSYASNLLLVLAAMIWGAAFVAQSMGAEFVGAFTFNAARSVLGGLVLIPVILIMDKQAGRRPSFWGTEDKHKRKNFLNGGLLCGTALTVAVALQQVGISHTTVGKSGFITALYIVIVPLLGIFVKKRVSLVVWLSVLIAVIGMYFLCITESLTINKGDVLMILCAVVFSFHILLVDHFAPKVDPVRLSAMQFFVCAGLSGVLMFVFETPTVAVLKSAWMPIVYAGVLSSGVGYTLQIVAQKRTHPVVASLTMSLESVFAALAAWIILGQNLAPREMLGSFLVFAAIVVSQVKVPGKVNPPLPVRE